MEKQNETTAIAEQRARPKVFELFIPIHYGGKDGQVKITFTNELREHELESHPDEKFYSLIEGRGSEPWISGFRVMWNNYGPRKELQKKMEEHVKQNS